MSTLAKKRKILALVVASKNTGTCNFTCICIGSGSFVKNAYATFHSVYLGTMVPQQSPRVDVFFIQVQYFSAM